MKVKIKLLHQDAKIPKYASEEAAGFDIYAIEDKVINKGEVAVLPTGLSLELEKGYCLQFWDRGGMGVKGIHHFGGLTDSDYRGELKVIVFNATLAPYNIEKGDRIIQGVILPVISAEFEEVESLSETKRGEGRFHSTGKK